MKHCGRCDRDLPLSSFGQRKTGAMRSECRGCEASRTRDYALANRDEVNEANREGMRRRRRDPVKGAAMRERERVWRDANRDRLRAQTREAKQRQKRDDFCGYHVQFVRRYNPTITAADLRAMWEAQDGLCGLTGQPLVAGQVQVDHIVPQTRGGSHDLANLRWVTKVANNAKRDLTDDEFLALCTTVGQWLGARIRAADEAAA